MTAADVLHSAEQRATALAAGDVAALKGLLHEDFTWTSHLGATYNRDEYIARNTDRRQDWRLQRMSEVVVTVVGTTAVLRCLTTDWVLGNARDPDGTFVMPMTQVWVHADGRWRCLAGHAGPCFPEGS